MNPDLRILIGEDDENDVVLLQRALLRGGITNPTHICRDGQEVINYLKGDPPYTDRDQFPFPRMLILDLKMPLLTGLDVLRWIRGHPECSVIPTLVLTTSAHERDVTDAYQVGANAYMVKPGSFDELVSLLKVMGEFWGRCQLPPLDIPKCGG
jgi:CheY-like chemotaxis protein